MQLLLRKIVTRPHRIAAILSSSKALQELSRHPHPTAQAIGAACYRALIGEVAPEERAAIARIEALRTRAAASQELLQVEDFGAVSPTANLTQEQMYAGRTVQRTVGESSRAASKRPVWTALLYQLVRAFAAKRCVELGCCVGVSAAYQTTAMQAAGPGGHLWTLEGAKALAEVSQRHFKQLGLDGQIDVVVGRFQDTLESLLQAQGPIDYAFIDGHHDEQATLRYLEQILPHCQPRAMLVFDDIDWSEGMKRAWQAIWADPRLPMAIDCGEIGVVVLDSTLAERIRVRAPLW